MLLCRRRIKKGVNCAPALSRGNRGNLIEFHSTDDTENLSYASDTHLHRKGCAVIVEFQRDVGRRDSKGNIGIDAVHAFGIHFRRLSKIVSPRKILECPMS